MAVQHVSAPDVFGPWVNVITEDGQTQRMVREAHAGEGWFIRLAPGRDGRSRIENNEFVTERIVAPIRLELADSCPAFARRAFEEN